MYLKKAELDCRDISAEDVSGRKLAVGTGGQVSKR